VNVGRDNLDMAIQRDGELLFARNMAGGGQPFTEAIMQTFGLKEGKAEANKIKKGDLTPRAKAQYPDSTTEKLANAMLAPAGQLVSQIQSTVMICRAQTKMPDLKVDRVLVAGGGARLRGLPDHLDANMDVSVEPFDPVQELDLDALEPGDAEELGPEPLDFAVAVGLAETQLLSNAYRLEVLSDREKKRRRFLERTAWTLGAAAAALVLVVLLFLTRADDIEKVNRANHILAGIEDRSTKVDQRGRKAEAAEQDRRRKEVVLRSRLWGGSFARAVLDLLARHHPENVYVTSFDLRTEKVALGLDGGRADRSDLRLDEGGPISAQSVWPVVEVKGVVQKTGPNPTQVYRDYVRNLRGALPAVDERPIKMDTSILQDRTRRFTLTFSWPSGAGAGGGG
ncbi:MAG: pilus assembly protein PilM, partial [Planctomycetota bacterium]